MNEITVLENIRIRMEQDSFVFASPEESIQLLEVGSEVKSNYDWSFSCEEFDEDSLESLTPTGIYEKVNEVQLTGDMLGCDFDEFETILAPAPNYLQIIKRIKEITR